MFRLCINLRNGSKEKEDYSKLKERAGDRSNGVIGRMNLPIKAVNQEEGEEAAIAMGVYY